MRFVYGLSLWLTFLALQASAQLQLSHPAARFISQRGSDGTSRIYLSGRFSGAGDRVEAQLLPVTAGQGVATGWQLVQANPANHLFLGYVTGQGGWYTLAVRLLLNGSVVEQTTLQPVGIGEVFVTAGQSNARGLGTNDNDLGANTDRVSTIDSINHYYPPGGRPLNSSGDPPPVPVYKALTAGRRIFPMSESSWGWGELGDYLVHRYNVPVAFYVTGWDASTGDNWASTANGSPPATDTTASKTGRISSPTLTSKTYCATTCLYRGRGHCSGIRERLNTVTRRRGRSPRMPIT